MKEKEFQQSIRKNKYQVFLLISPITRPLSFASHVWIVTGNRGKMNRWEVWQFKGKCKTSFGHVHKNLFDLLVGMKKYPFGKSRFESKLLGKIEGAKNSLAKKIVDFIEKNAGKYKYAYKYRYVPGPNSNSFVQWILDEFPESRLKLPQHAIGKNYK